MIKTILLVSVVVLVTASFSNNLLARLTIGTLAPNFTLRDSNGQFHSLSTYKDNYVVLEWTNHDCPFVVKHYKSGNMQKLQNEFTNKGVIWLTIISSAPANQGYCTPEKANKIVDREKASPSAVLLDPEGTVGRLYNAITTPHMYIVDPAGTLLYQGAIDSIRSTKIADIPKAKNYVWAALNASMNGKAIKMSDTRPYGCSVKYAKFLD